MEYRAQVLAGALKDNGRGKVVGETTFGKGLIQTIVELSDGSGVAVTVARYQTPDGTDINKKGIQPDIAIDTGNISSPRLLLWVDDSLAPHQATGTGLTGPWLRAESMPPTNGAGFCKYVAERGAAMLFDPAAAGGLSVAAKLEQASSSGVVAADVTTISSLIVNDAPCAFPQKLPDRVCIAIPRRDWQAN